MGSRPFVLKPDDRQRDLDAIGVRVTVLASGLDIEDQQITEQSGAEGAGPPPHHQEWDESFYVTKGQVEFSCGGETTMCPAGTLVRIPAGNVHAFSFGPGGGGLLEITGRRSQAAEMFTAVDREIQPGPPDESPSVRSLIQEISHGSSIEGVVRQYPIRVGFIDRDRASR